MIGVVIPHLGSSASAGGTFEAIVGVVALLLVGFALLWFVIWGTREQSAHQSVEPLETTRPLPHAA